MASSDARPVPRRNTAFRLYFGIRNNAGDLVTSAVFNSGLTSGANKVVLSKDGATPANSTNSVSEVGHGAYYLELTSTEMDCDGLVVVIKTTTTAAKNELITLYPEEAGDLRLAAADVAGAVWNAATSSYNTGGTFGNTNQ